MTSVNIRNFVSYTKYARFRELLRTANSVSEANRRKYTSAADHYEAEPEPELSQTQTPLYVGHRPTTFFQKVLLTTGSAAMSLYNPHRGDMIATLGDVTGYPALKYMKQKMEQDPVGRQILEEQPEITTETLDIDYLGSLPENTFGKQYWHFLDANGFSPDARLPVHFVDDPELVYVMLRYRQCHDLFHTVLGMKPNMLGECVVKCVEALQTGLPMCALGAVFGPLRLGPMHRDRYLSLLLAWSIRNGLNARFLMAVYYEKHWETDITELRQQLNIEPPPVVELKKKPQPQSES